MYSVILLDSRSKQQLLKLPFFTSALDAKQFCKGFRYGVTCDQEMPDESEPPMYTRGWRFSVTWQIYAMQWDECVKPLVSVGSV